MFTLSLEGFRPRTLSTCSDLNSSASVRRCLPTRLPTALSAKGHWTLATIPRSPFAAILDAASSISPVFATLTKNTRGGVHPARQIFSFRNLTTRHSQLSTISFTIRTSAKLACNPFRIRTSKTQHLKLFRMNTYKKTGWGEVMVTQGGTANPGGPLPNLNVLTPRVAACRSNVTVHPHSTRLRERRLPRSGRGVTALSFSAQRPSTFDFQLSTGSIPLDPRSPHTYSRTPHHAQNNFWNDCGDGCWDSREEIFCSRGCGRAPRTSCGSATEAECVCAPRCRWRSQTSKNCGSCGVTRGSSRAVARRATNNQELYRRCRMAGASGIVAAERVCAATRCAPCGAAACCRRDCFREYKYAGIFDGVRDRQFFEWQDKQSLGCGEVGRRLERRRGRSDRIGMLGGRSGERRGRIDPRAGAFLRDLRTETDPGAHSGHRTFSRRRRRIRMDWRCWADGADRRGRARSV